MKKFFILLKKEIRELLTPQVIIPLLITVVLFAAIGKIATKAQNNDNKQSIVIVDQDHTKMADMIKGVLGQSFKIENNDQASTDQALAKAKSENRPLVIIIPEGFEKSINNLAPQKLEIYTIFKNFSFTGTKNYQTVTTALSAVNESLSNNLISTTNSNDVNVLKHPLATTDYVVIGNKEASANPAAVINFISSQTTFIPIILFIVIIFASQMIATAIASEKENKTLETLLTVPVSRKYIVVSKMAAAGIVALLSSAVYIFGFRFYMNGMTGGAMNTSIAGMDEVIRQLGISFSIANYIVLGTSLFFGILAALSISIIIGAFAEDVKSVANVTAPLMVLVAIPYFLTLFLDIGSLSPVAKYLVYIIPFTHSFLAAPNILLGNYALIIWGIIYQFIFFVIFVIIASKIFSTDKIVTMKLNFGKKKN